MPMRPPIHRPHGSNAASHRAAERRRDHDRRRRGLRLYDTQRWKRARRHFLQANPLCATCQSEGRVRLATVVDHVIPHRGRYRFVLGPDQLVARMQASPRHQDGTGTVRGRGVQISAAVRLTTAGLGKFSHGQIGNLDFSKNGPRSEEETARSERAKWNASKAPRARGSR